MLYIKRFDDYYELENFVRECNITDYFVEIERENMVFALHYKVESEVN